MAGCDSNILIWIRKLGFYLLFLLMLQHCSEAAEKKRIFRSDETQENWKLIEEPESCTLTQKIIGYGEARVFHPAGMPQRFQLIQEHDLYNSVSATVHAEKPGWKLAGQNAALGTETLTPGQHVLTVVAPKAEKFISPLQQGLYLHFIYYLHYVEEEQINIMVSPVKFQRAWWQYQACEKSMRPFSFRQLEHFDVYFPTGKSILPPKESEKLLNIKHYKDAGGKITKIHLTGHTDSQGRVSYNRVLLKRRVEAVKAFLVKQSLASDLIVIEPDQVAPRVRGFKEIDDPKRRKVVVRLEGGDQK